MTASLLQFEFRPHWFTLQKLVEADALLGSVAEVIAHVVRDRETILVSGGTDTGKTTFTMELGDFIPRAERLGVVEDTMELKIDERFPLRSTQGTARRSWKHNDAGSHHSGPGESDSPAQAGSTDYW